MEKYRSLKALSETPSTDGPPFGTHGGQACPPSEVDEAAITLLMMSRGAAAGPSDPSKGGQACPPNKLFRAVVAIFEREARKRRQLEYEVANLRSMLCVPHFVPFVVPNNFGGWLGAPSPQL